MGATHALLDAVLGSLAAAGLGANETKQLRRFAIQLVLSPPVENTGDTLDVTRRLINDTEDFRSLVSDKLGLHQTSLCCTWASLGATCQQSAQPIKTKR